MEHPRDPLEEPGPYECVPQGGFRRLMLATTFESPFAKKKLGLLSPLGLDEVGGLLAWRGLAWLGFFFFFNDVVTYWTMIRTHVVPDRQ